MNYLIGVTILWALSFSLIGEFLAGRVDSYFSVLIRVALASFVFLPFMNFRGITHSLKLKIMAIGAVQLGIMYLFFFNSFLFLSVPEVILFTIFTPIYVTLIYDALHIRFLPLYLLTASLAVVGAFIIRYDSISSDFVVGFLLVQGANICFALGQVSYKFLMEKKSMQEIPHLSIFGYFHLGSLVVAVIAVMIFGNTQKMEPTLAQWGILVWLGIAASGAGYFLWNKGACKVDSGVLAIMNNVLVPVALIVNLVIWSKDINLVTLTVGGTIILFSLYLHKYIIKRDKHPNPYM